MAERGVEVAQEMNSVARSDPVLPFAMSEVATAAPRVTAELGRRAAVTLGTVALWLVGENVPLPFLDQDQLRLLAGSGLSRQSLSPLAVGLAPLFVAFVLVECAALVFPRLRWRRHGSAAERRPLTLAAWGIAVVLATIQGWSIATSLQMVHGFYGLPLLDYGLNAALGVTGSLVLGTIVAASAAVTISRWGLGNGFALLSAVEAMETAYEMGKLALLQPGESWNDETRVVALALLVVVPLIIGHWWHHRSAGPRIPVPTCGLVLIQLPAIFLLFSAALASWFPELSPLEKALQSNHIIFVGVYLTLIVGLALFLARIFCAPEAVMCAYRRAEPERFDENAVAEVRQALSTANRRSMVVVVGVALIPTVAATLDVPISFTMPVLFELGVLVAVALDLFGEVKARVGAGVLVSARPLHRVYAVEPVLKALAAAGIAGFARTRYYRALFHFFAPYAPIEILVPPDRAAEANEICGRIGR